MSNVIARSLHTLPVELVYRICDNLDPFIILISLRNVCARLDAIIDSYHPYRVSIFIKSFRMTVCQSTRHDVLTDKSINDHEFQSLCNALHYNTTITTLSFTNNNLGIEGAKYLSRVLMNNTVLTTLDLESNGIGDEGAEHLANAVRVNTTLTALSLYGNQIGDRGALSLSNALETNKVLTILDLWCNQIGDIGTLYLVNALQTNNTLIKLNLYDNCTSDEIIPQLKAAPHIVSKQPEFEFLVGPLPLFT